MLECYTKNGEKIILRLQMLIKNNKISVLTTIHTINCISNSNKGLIWHFEIWSIKPLTLCLCSV
jgi:hypothetical protein